METNERSFTLNNPKNVNIEFDRDSYDTLKEMASVIRMSGAAAVANVVDNIASGKVPIIVCSPFLPDEGLEVKTAVPVMSVPNTVSVTYEPIPVDTTDESRAEADYN